MSINYVGTGQMRHLRACMVCCVVQLQQKFLRDGCPNCEDILELANRPDSVQDCTSQVYEGLITLADPTASWVARWQRLDKYKPGIYAVKVVGILPPEVLDSLKSSGVKYIKRDGGEDDDEDME